MIDFALVMERVFAARRSQPRDDANQRTDARSESVHTPVYVARDVGVIALEDEPQRELAKAEPTPK